MKTRQRTVIIFAIIFIGLAVLVFLQAQQPAAPDSPYSSNRVFVSFGELDVQAIRLRNPAGTDSFTLNRAVDGTWTAPDSTGILNTYVADLITRTLVILPYISTFQPGDDLSDYGFAPNALISVEFFLTDGSSHVVAVGVRNPTETGYYALVDNRPEIYILERAAVDFLISVLRNPPLA